MHRVSSLRSICVIAILFLFTIIFGCGGGSGGSSSGGSGAATKAAIVLPPGFPLAATALHVTTMLGKSSVAANGAFSAATTGNGPQLVCALTSAGKLVMLGFVEPGITGGVNQISVQQSAVALLYIAIGGFTTDAQQYPQLLKLITASPATAQLASVIASRLAVNPTAISDGDAQITTALGAARQAILPAENFGATAAASKAAVLTRVERQAPVASSTTVTVSRAAAGPTRDAQNLVLISPNPADQQSGVQVQQQESGPGIIVTNNFRRHCQFYIYKTGDVSTSGNTIAVDPPQEFQGPFDLPSTQRLSGVIESVLDIAEGKVFWSPVSSPPITLPLDPDMKKTIYSVVVVGPSFSTNVTGILTDPRFTAQVPIWQNEITALTFQTAVGDFLLPTLLAILVPQATISDVLGDNRIVQFNQDAVNIITQDAPEVWSDLQELASVTNTNKPAACAALIKDFVGALAGTPEFRSVLLNRLFQLPSLSSFLNKEIEDGPEIMKAIGEANEFLEALDLAMRAGDDAAILHDFVVSNSAESWEADIVPPNVHLDPSSATISSSDSIVVLTASIPGVTDLTPFRFSWSTTGSEGHLESTKTPTPLPAGPIPDSTADYVADLLTITPGGSDTVTVRVFNASDLTTPIGQATSTIGGGGPDGSFIAVDTSRYSGGAGLVYADEALSVKVSPTSVTAGQSFTVSVKCPTDARTLSLGCSYVDPTQVFVDGVHLDPKFVTPSVGIFEGFEPDNFGDAPSSTCGPFNRDSTSGAVFALEPGPHTVQLTVLASAPTDFPHRDPPNGQALGPIIGPWIVATSLPALGKMGLAAFPFSIVGMGG